MKIHLGCGRNILGGYINVDSAPFKIDINSLNVDPQTTQFIQSDAISFLSYLSDKNIDEIKSEHFLEHLTRTQMCRLL